MLDSSPLSRAYCGAPLSQAELGFRSWSAGLDFLALRALFRAASRTVTNRTGAGAHLAVLDVGANVGGGSLLLAEEFQQATVFSFEPQPLVRARLQRALSAANASHGYRFQVVPHAVSNVHGKAVPFYTPRTYNASDSFTGSGLAPRTGFSVTTSDSHTVTTVRIDSWCRSMGLTPSFVKIDTEGFDAFVLDGMDGLLASHTPRALIFELNPRLWPGAAKAMAADGRRLADVAPVASRDAEHRADGRRKVALVDAAYSLSLQQLLYALEKYGYAVYMLSPRKLLRLRASCWQEQYAHWAATMNAVAVQRGKTEHALVSTYASVAGTLMPGAMRPSKPQAQAPQKKGRGLDAHAQRFPAGAHHSYSRRDPQSHMITHCPVSRLRVNTSHLDWVIVSMRGLCLTQIGLRRLLFYFRPRRVFYITGRPADCAWIRAIDTRVVCVDEASYYSAMRMNELRVACASEACFPPANCSDPRSNIRPFGWYVQQFIKLGVSRYIADLSLRYVLWDADNVALFGKELLTRDGRVILQGNPRSAPYGYDEVYRTLVGERVPTPPSGITNWVVGYMVVDVRVARAMLSHMESRMHAPWPRCVCTALHEVADSAKTGLHWFSEYQSYTSWLISHQPHAVALEPTALAYPRNPGWWHREAMRGKCCIEEDRVCALGSGNREHFFAVIEEHKYRYRDSVCRDWQRVSDAGFSESDGLTPLMPEPRLVAPEQTKFRNARIFHVHRSRTSNIGDCFSSPLQHLPLLNSATTATFDIEESAVANVAAFAIDKRDLIIVGGGGLLDIKDAWTAQLLHYCSHSSCLLWGPGFNSKPGVLVSTSTVSILQLASGTWLRDFGLGQLKSSSSTFRSMLDASCLMPELDQNCVKERAVGYYLRGEFDFARKHGVNASDVWHNTGSVGDALHFICTSRSIVTNSYHGLLWAEYMGVPAKLDGSQRSTKFHHMPFRPKLWKPGPSTEVSVDGVALKATCRAQNMHVYEKHVLPIVLRVLGLTSAETAVVQRRVLILTAARNAAEAQKYRFAQFTHQWYSAHHDVKVSVCPSELQNRSFWLKLECIERHMTANVSWILWLDSDVVITALLPIERWTREAELRGANVVAQHMGTRINNGVFLIRNSAGGRNFLRAWQKASWLPYAHDNGHFNVAALDLYDSRRCHGPWTMDSEAKNRYDRCFNQIMSEDPSMCRHTTGAPQHFMLESGVWVICPRSGLVPPLQSEDAARSAKQHVPSTTWKSQDFTLHSKTPLAYLESVLNRSSPHGGQIFDVIREFGSTKIGSRPPPSVEELLG